MSPNPMRSLRRGGTGTWLPCLLATVLLLAGAGRAQENLTKDPGASLAAAQKRLQDLKDPKTPADQQWHSSVSRRIELLQELLRTQEAQKTLPTAEQADADRKQAEQDLAAERKLKPPAAVEMTSVDEVSKYEQREQDAKGVRDSLKERLGKLKDSQQQGQKEQATLAKREAGARQSREKLTGSDELSRYRAANTRLDLHIAAARRSYLGAAIARWPAMIAAAQMQADLAELKLGRAQEALTLARKEVVRIRSDAAAKERKKAEEETAKAEETTDPVKQFRSRVRAEVADRNGKAMAVKAELEKLKNSKAEETRLLASIKSSRERLEQRLEVQSEGADDLLRRARHRAERQQQLLQRVTQPQLIQDARHIQDELSNTLDRLWDIQLRGSENKIREQLLAATPKTRTEEATRVFDDVMSGPKGLVSALESYRTELQQADDLYDQLERMMRLRDAALTDYIVFINSRLLWTRSDRPMSLTMAGEVLKDFSRAAETLDKPEVWRAAWSNVDNRLLHVVALATLFLAVLLIAGFRRFRRRDPVTATLAQDAKPEPATPPHHTPRAWLRALLRILIQAAPLPIALVIAARLVEDIATPVTLSAPLIHCFEILAWVFAIRGVAVAVLAPWGMGVRMGMVLPDVAAQLLRSIRLVTSAAILLYMPSEILATDPFKLEHLPRLLHTLWLIAATVSMVLLLRRNRPLIQRWTQPRSTTRRTLALLTPLFVAGLMAAITMDVVGFRIASSLVMHNMSRVFVAVLVLIACYTLLRRLSDRMAAAILRRIAQEEGSKDAMEASAAAVQFLSRAVAAFVVILGAIALQYFWNVGFAVAGLLQEQLLVDVGNDKWLTAWDVVLALVYILVGHFLCHGVSQAYSTVIVPLFRREHEGGRFVAVTLIRYALLLTAYAVALLTLGVSFAGLGWILTAASVGLGFGLQEIVANFISGLILLFERPVRVGDVISVGTTGGTVDKITIRATYVTNWERQTIVVPNKNFITQEVTNWTRADQIMRRTLKVGVAHGANVEKVLALLDEIVGSHPRVLKSPPHRIWFLGFNEYGLDIVIWAFAHLDFGYRTMTELYTQIYERFEEEGIEISVPKRDVMMRQEQEEPPMPIHTLPRPDAPRPVTALPENQPPVPDPPVPDLSEMAQAEGPEPPPGN